MSRRISTELQAHLNGSVTTVCKLLRIILKDGRAFGLCSLDRDIEYRDTVYHASNGFDASMVATNSGMTVDNAEAYALLSGDIPGITLEMASSGELDDANWEMLLVNYRDLSMGHVILDAGDLGEVNVEDDVVFVPELLSYVMRLRQPIGHYWSRHCRAIFGTPAEGQTGCGVNTDPLWVAATVTGVGDEMNRVFADEDLILNPVPRTARVQWLSGPNAGSRLYQVEGYSETSGTVVLVEPTPFPISEGHQFRIRPDCDKYPATCKEYNNWLNYKGESLIPVGEGAASLTPSASVPGGFMGSEVVDD